MQVVEIPQPKGPIARVARLLSLVINPNFCQFAAFLYICPRVTVVTVLEALFFLFIFPFLAYVVYMKYILQRQNLYVLERNKRYIPFIMNIFSVLCYYGLMIAGLTPTEDYTAYAFEMLLYINVLSFVITSFWRISLHMVASATVVTIFLLDVQHYHFSVSPLSASELVWNYSLVLLTPFVGWSRFYLRAHTVPQIIGGTLVGIAFAAIYLAAIYS